MIDAYNNELWRAQVALESRTFSVCFEYLERAHILSQRMPARHFYVHWRMFVVGLYQHDLREVVGQLPRMVAALLFSRIWVPAGNTGRARVSTFRPMAIPEDLRLLLSQAD
ncbi:MAG: DUF3703 domain-containing protein [Rhodocyclaceae bacterium]|nr:DUF3703 domain-containing protein [Rhodocyclaceae bacterium]MCA3081607.1 DUF3703 domain-containing protein [Rhodocyclaceae bacterium]